MGGGRWSAGEDPVCGGVSQGQTGKMVVVVCCILDLLIRVLNLSRVAQSHLSPLRLSPPPLDGFRLRNHPAIACQEAGR